MGIVYWPLCYGFVDNEEYERFEKLYKRLTMLEVPDYPILPREAKWHKNLDTEGYEDSWMLPIYEHQYAEAA